MVQLIHVGLQDIRCLLADAAVIPGTRITHQRVQCRAVVTGIFPSSAIYPFMGYQKIALLIEDIDVIGIDTGQHLLVAVFRPCGVVMLAILSSFILVVQNKGYIG